MIIPTIEKFKSSLHFLFKLFPCKIKVRLSIKKVVVKMPKAEEEINKLLDEFNTNREKGLTDHQVEERLHTYGENRFIEDKPPSIWALIWGQINNGLIYILLGAALISAFVGEISDAVIIALVIIINTTVGVLQEAKAEKSLIALRKMTTPSAVVLRNGIVQEIPAEQLVPGDIVYIEAGRIVPADLRLIETTDLQVEESSLTGESISVEKDAQFIGDKDLPIGDQKHMAFMTTIATYGRAKGIVLATGMKTEVGKIASMLQKQEKELTPLQEKLNDLGKILGIAAIMVSVIIFLIGYAQGRDVLDLFLIAVSLAVAAIPEGLPAIVTIVLALGVQRMIKRHAIVRQLPAVETLGAVDVICSDKTGTLTQNKMTMTHGMVSNQLQEIENFSMENETTRRFIEAIVLCNNATMAAGEQTGDPTEVALLEAGAKVNLHKTDLEATYQRVGEIPFDSDRKMMTTIHKDGDSYLIFVKGALERLLPKLSKIEKNGKAEDFTEDSQRNILETVETMASQALRILGVAYKRVPANSFTMEEAETDLTFLGLTGMIDPPREEVKDSIALCHTAGIDVVMITGDHQKTALAIAKELGIANDEHETVTGETLNKTSDSQLKEMVKTTKVFARVSPEHKVRIVKALKANDKVVSMTGDGVNDAPSLRAADVGVAMGITGTDVAKGASDIVLTDDNFTTITAAIEEGRNIYQNIKKSILFLLSCNLGEIITLFIGILMGWPAPLTAIHILWVNLITDTLPAISLGIDPKEKDMMQHQPRSSKEGIFVREDVSFILWNGLLIGLLTLFAFMEGLKFSSDASSLWTMDLQAMSTESIIHAQTLAFLTLSISQLFHAFNLRSREKSIFQVGFFSNPYLFGAVVIGIGLQLCLVHIPVLNNWFHLQPISGKEWLFVLGLSLIPLLLNEVIKAIKRIFQQNATIKV